MRTLTVSGAAKAICSCCDRTATAEGYHTLPSAVSRADVATRVRSRAREDGAIRRIGTTRSIRGENDFAVRAATGCRALAVQARVKSALVQTHRLGAGSRRHPMSKTRPLCAARSIACG